MDKWPNFFIVGTPRAGTTTLHELLNKTERVYMSPHKEPHYFTKSIAISDLYKPVRDKKKYLQLFQKARNEKAIGESSTSYLWDAKAPSLIHEVVPDAKIIIILRNPVERAYSYYLWRISNGKTYSFSEAISEALESKDDFFKGLIINGGWYFDQVLRYQNIFGKNRIMILIFEEFIKDPKKTVKEVLNFLGVNSEPPDSVELVHNTPTIPRGKLSTLLLQNNLIKKMGEQMLPTSVGEYVAKRILGKKISKPKMEEKDRVFLKNLYHEDMKKLKELLNRDLPWN